MCFTLITQYLPMLTIFAALLLLFNYARLIAKEQHKCRSILRMLEPVQRDFLDQNEPNSPPKETEQ